MKALHPPGSAVHRGYSYPGLEKVSDVIQEEVREVRSVPDFKVCTGAVWMGWIWWRVQGLGLIDE